MTYLEFYQAWLELVMQNNQIVSQSISKFFCQNQITPIIAALSIPVFIFLIRKSINDIGAATLLFCGMIITIWGSYLTWDSISEKFPPECRKSLFIEYSNSLTELPEKDYTVEEFQENIAKIGQKASPEQIELAKTIFKDCFENLPSDYQVNHSSIVRRCIADSGTQRVFEEKDVETYKNKFINELN